MKKAVNPKTNYFKKEILTIETIIKYEYNKYHNKWSNYQQPI